MAEYGSSIRPDWVPVTIRVVLPAGISRAEAFDAAEHQILTLKIRIKFDRGYPPWRFARRGPSWKRSARANGSSSWSGPGLIRKTSRS